MNLSDFDYYLPKELIAQKPISPRDHARLMIVDRNNQTIKHAHVYDLPSFLSSSDILVMNNTKVFNARLSATVGAKQAELFLARPVENGWLCIGKPSKLFQPHEPVIIADDFRGTVIERRSDGSFIVSFPYPNDDVIQKANRYGTIPTPPYIKNIPKADEYQTSYAKVVGSVAAPTAGFHFTPSLLKTIKEKGFTMCELTLHVSIGTFLPIQSKTIEDHMMHSEWMHLSQETADIINRAKINRQRIIAIGTTTTRALEGVGSINKSSTLHEYTGDVSLFIKPGFQFRIIDSLFTNFHLPKSTLLLLVSAFAGIDLIKRAYQEAIDHNYRFYSFGDAMMIV
ncbi:MAG: tRNA preQ1(34) S-adenosylmethionine ribosyltransferase-isomerase QueA [Patescibacteria group bacterium]|nr:tRNA preQ1(34) S-adenosylmethionine ribosyltransferase-isomerase QueA [Patescibacteria group bacterium]